MKTANGLVRFVIRAHGHEAEAPRTAGLSVGHQFRFDHRAVSGKGVLQVIFGCVERKVSDKQFITHMISIFPLDRPSLPDCSHIGFRIITELSSPEDLPRLENDELSNRVKKHGVPYGQLQALNAIN